MCHQNNFHRLHGCSCNTRKVEWLCEAGNEESTVQTRLYGVTATQTRLEYYFSGPLALPGHAVPSIDEVTGKLGAAPQYVHEHKVELRITVENVPCGNKVCWLVKRKAKADAEAAKTEDKTDVDIAAPSTPVPATAVTAADTTSGSPVATPTSGTTRSGRGTTSEVITLEASCGHALFSSRVTQASAYVFDTDSEVVWSWGGIICRACEREQAPLVVYAADPDNKFAVAHASYTGFMARGTRFSKMPEVNAAIKATRAILKGKGPGVGPEAPMRLGRKKRVAQEEDMDEDGEDGE